MAGAFNLFATGIGNTDAGFVMGTGKLLIKVPRDDALPARGKIAARRDGEGRDPAIASVKSVSDGATYRAMQFGSWKA